MLVHSGVESLTVSLDQNNVANSIRRMVSDGTAKTLTAPLKLQAAIRIPLSNIRKLPWTERVCKFSALTNVMADILIEMPFVFASQEGYHRHVESMRKASACDLLIVTQKAKKPAHQKLTFPGSVKAACRVDEVCIIVAGLTLTNGSWPLRSVRLTVTYNSFDNFIATVISDLILEALKLFISLAASLCN